MAHAFTRFLREQTDQRGWAQVDVVNASKLSRALVSKWLTDDRDHLTRLPDRDTVAAFARAFGVSTEFLLGKAVEATGMGYTAGDFVNSVRSASDADLLHELQRRLAERPAVSTDSFSHETKVQPASGDNVRAFPPAARRTSEVPGLQRQADEQDADAHAPDPEGPDTGL